MPSELLHQLMSNNTNRGRPKSKSNNWLIDGGGQKAACISQPSDSVLMNLLVSGFDIRAGYICLAPTKSKRWMITLHSCMCAVLLVDKEKLCYEDVYVDIWLNKNVDDDFIHLHCWLMII